jgi:hypothetical protein
LFHNNKTLFYKRVCYLNAFLFFLNRFGRAGIRAGTAVDAKIRIYFVFAIAFFDRTYGTFVYACAAANASVGNFIRHSGDTSISI